MPPTLSRTAQATGPRRRKLAAQIAQLTRTAKSGEQWAEICRLEAEMLGGPWFGAEVRS